MDMDWCASVVMNNCTTRACGRTIQRRSPTRAGIGTGGAGKVLAPEDEPEKKPLPDRQRLGTQTFCKGSDAFE